MERRLAAILAADVFGYSRLMEADEEATLATLNAYREIIDGLIAEHRGRVFGSAGDSMIAEFASPVEAVRAAIDIQREIEKRNAELPEDRRMRFRVGVNLGDVMAEGDDLFGDGVNVAARLEALAAPGGICVSGKVHDEVIGKVDMAFADAGEHVVKNIDRPVRVWSWPTEGVRAAHRVRPWRGKAAAVAVALVGLAAIGGAITWYQAREDTVLALPSGPSIAVLPFTNLSGDPNDAYFSVGLTEDIITALSRFSGLLVFARESTSQFTGGSVDPREVGRKLGARYVLAGSVRRSQDQLRVTTRLLDAEDGTQLWSESYDRNLTMADVFAVQDEITGRVVGIIGSPDAPWFKSEIQKELRTKRPDSLEAYECVLLSNWIYDDFLPEAHAQARDCLERAVELEPEYSLAWSHLGQMYFEEYKYGYNRRPEPVERAIAAVQKALELDRQDQYANYMLALMLYVQERSFGPFYAAAERAIALNPNAAFVLADLGTWIAYSGEWERGKALVEKSMKLNPFHKSWLPFSFFLDHYRKSEYREALVVVLKINLPNNEGVQTGLAAVYGQLGETEKSKAIVDHLLAIRPGFADDPRGWFVRRRMPDELVESLMDGLRKAGLNVPPAE